MFKIFDVARHQETGGGGEGFAQGRTSRIQMWRRQEGAWLLNLAQLVISRPEHVASFYQCAVLPIQVVS